MTKPRAPETWADAVTLAIALIGVDACARAIEKSESLVRKFSDPDHESLPTLAQALAIDRACAAAGHEPPLAALYARLIAPVAPAAERKAPKDRALDIMCEAGGVAEAVRAAHADGTVSAAEAALIQKEARELRAKVDALLGDLAAGALKNHNDGPSLASRSKPEGGSSGGQIRDVRPGPR